MSKLAAIRPAHWAAGVLLLIATIAPLWVSSYAKATPKLWGFPFFYWYQLLWVFIAALLVSIAYRLVLMEERKRRAAEKLDRRTSEEADGDE